MKRNYVLLLVLFVFPVASFAASKPAVLDGNHFSWMLVATLLVLLMTIPGVVFFYGGLVGSLLTGVFAESYLGGSGYPMHHSMLHQVITQGAGIVATIIWSGGISYILLKVISSTIGLRVNEDIEERGLDVQSSVD
jgi:ammonia channel protein AmtB